MALHEKNFFVERQHISERAWPLRLKAHPMRWHHSSVDVFLSLGRADEFTRWATNEIVGSERKHKNGPRLCVEGRVAAKGSLGCRLRKF
jgi:hypothetical protein